MSTGNVSIRLSIQDGETVRAALEKLGSDGEAALKKLQAATTHPSQGLTAIDQAVAGVRDRMESAAESLGPVGTLLSGLGPIGMAAAAGLAGVVAIMYEMSKAANELADRSIAIKNFAEATGLTTTQVQALSGEGAKFSLTSEQISSGLQRLSVNLDAAHRGTGSLYEDLIRINPELAHQVSAAKDVASAYDLIGRAIAQANQAGNASQANTIARAAFGRNPGQQGNLAADVSGAGGVNALADSYQRAGKALDEGLIKNLATLKTEIAETNQLAKDIASSIFAEDTLERAKAWADAWLAAAKAAKEMHDATKGESWGDWFSRQIANMGAASAVSEGADPELLEQARREALEAAARRRLQQGLAAGQGSDLSNVWQPPGAGGNDPTAAVWKIGDAANDAKVPIEVVLADTKKWMAVLGQAATPAEQLHLKLLELTVAVKDHAASTQVAARAEAQLKDAQAVSTVQARERLSLASQEEIVAAGLIQLQKDRADGFIKTDAEMAQAEANLLRQAKLTYEQEQAKNSAFPGLTQMGQSNVNSDLDKLGTSTLNNLSKSIVTTMMNTRNAGDAFRKFGLDAIQAVEQIIVKILVLEPLAKSLSSALGGGFGSFLGLGGASSSVNPDSAAGRTLFASSIFAAGGIMTSRGPLPLRRYAGGGVANSPQLAMFGEGSGPEAYVPLPDGRAIPVRLNGGGGGTVNSNMNLSVTVPAGTSTEDAHRMAQTFARSAKAMVEQAVDERIITHMRTGGLLNPA